MPPERRSPGARRQLAVRLSDRAWDAMEAMQRHYAEKSGIDVEVSQSALIEALLLKTAGELGLLKSPKK